MPIKIIVSMCSKLMLIYTQKSTSSLTSFLRFWKEIANFIFSVIWACHTPKMIVWIWRNLWCLSASKISFSSFTFYLRYGKDIVNFSFWVGIQKEKTKCDTIKTFVFICLPKINVIKFKKPYFGATWAKINFSGKKSSVGP